MKSTFNFLNTANPRSQHIINTSIIFNHIRVNNPTSRAKISKDLGISAPAVSRAIEKLIKKGYVVEAERVKTKMGKRPTPLIINKNKFFVVGIDLGKERLKMALVNLGGEVADKFTGSVISKDKKAIEKTVTEVKEFIKKYTSGKNLNSYNIKAICTGVPAAIDIDKEKVVSTNHYKDWEWKDFNLKNIITGEFDIPLFVENDANLSAIGEKHYGEGQKHSNIVYIEISSGIGAGIIIDNKLIKGSSGTAGEIGFIISNSKKLDFKIKDMVKNNIERITPYIVCEAATKHDKLANDIITHMVELLSVGIINLILIVNPQLVILGGDFFNLPEVSKLFIKPITEKIRKYIPFIIPEIRVSSLGDETCIRGASFNAIESMLVKEFPYRIEQNILS